MVDGIDVIHAGEHTFPSASESAPWPRGVC